MKILKVVHGFPPECSGGTESYVLRLSKELVALGHGVTVVTGSHESRPAPLVERYVHEGLGVFKLHRSGLFVDDWDRSYAPEIEPALDAVLKSVQPDFVHVHHWIRLSRHLVSFFHARGIPALCTLHDLWTTCPIAFRVRKGSFCELPAGAASCHDCAPHARMATDLENAEALELFREDFRNELALARRVIVPSNAHRAAVLKHHPTITGKIRVVPHGAISDLRPRRSSSQRDRLRIGHWGHLSTLKGLDLLLEAVARLEPAIRERIEVHVFGTIVYPGEKERLETLARQSGAIMHGAFTPSDLENAGLGLAVIPTRCSESFSFVLDEAFMLDLPAIVPARGALAERVGKAGATFEPENAADLAAKITHAVSHPDLVERWRDAIPRLRPFAAHAREILAVYEDVRTSHAPLPQTPSALSDRRAIFRSLQVEARNKQIEYLDGDKRNLADDVARANVTMREMDRFHVEKDKVIDDLSREARSRREAVDVLNAQIDESRAAVSDLVAELGKARLEMNDVVRLASDRERDVAMAAVDAFAAQHQDLARRDLLLTETARSLESLATRLAAAERAVAQARTAPGRVEPASLIDRLKRTAFGDERKQTRLRVLYVIHQFPPRHVAGTEICTLELAKEMKARGHRVVVLTCEAHHDRPPFEHTRREHDGIPIHEVVHNYHWSSFEETYDSPRADAIFERVLDEETPDVVHVQHLHYFSANFLTIAHRRNIPVVFTLHDYGILCSRDGQMRRADGEICDDAIPTKCADCIAHFPLAAGHVAARNRLVELEGLVPEDVRRMMRRVHAGLSPMASETADATGASTPERYVEAAAERLNAWRHATRKVDLFVSPSHFLRDVFARSGVVDADRIIVAPNGQNVVRFRNQPPRVRGAALRVGYIGTIAEHKGVHVLIEAMNGLVDQPAAECRIWGELNAFVEYTERLRALSTNPRTELMGAFEHRDAPRILAEIDVLVIPSLWFENAPMTVQEAALARVPVIASDIGGLAEHVIEGRSGLSFFTGDAEDLRKKILWFVEDFSRCDQFDFASVPIVTIAQQATELEQRYSELVSRAGVRASS